MYVVLEKFLLELRLPAPGRILPSIVGEKLFWNSVFAGRPSICLDHALRTLAPVHAQASNEPGVVIDEPDDVGVFAKDLEDCDVALPELIRFAVLESAIFKRLLPALLLVARHVVPCEK